MAICGGDIMLSAQLFVVAFGGFGSAGGWSSLSGAEQSAMQDEATSRALAHAGK